MLDRPRWLDMAADMLAVPLDRPRDQVRAALADPERVRAALENAEPEGARRTHAPSLAEIG